MFHDIVATLDRNKDIYQITRRKVSERDPSLL